MKMLLFLLTMITWSSIYAQEEEAPVRQIIIRDSINNALTGTGYVPFNITTLDGKQIDNASIKDKVTFFSFWHRYCAPCLAEFDELNELYGHFRNDTNVVFVAITFDRKEDITDVLKKYKVIFPVATISSQNEAYRMNYNNGFPSVILLDREVKIRRSGLTTIVANDDETGKFSITMDSAVKLINRYKSN